MIVCATVAVLFNISAISAAQETLLSSEAAVYAHGFDVAEKGEVFVALTLRAPECSWGSRKARAVVLNVSVDGAHSADVVVFGGGEPLEYTALLGELAPGSHTLSVAFDTAHSPAPDASAVLEKAVFHVFTPENENYEVYRHAPVLYLYGGDPANDIPLLIYALPRRGADALDIGYEVAFSNEDGGTGAFPAMLMVQYGRILDLEWMYHARVAADGSLIHERYQGEEHQTRAFTGEKTGAHPVLRVSTRNGNFNQDGRTALRVAYMPVVYEDNGRPREALLDENPWMVRVANEEMFFERKAYNDDAKRSIWLGDMRDYVYLDISAQNNSGQPTLAVNIQLKDDDFLFSSDPGARTPLKPDMGRISWSGVFRTNVRLPRGTRPEDISRIIFSGSEDVRYVITEVRAFMLDKNFKPLKPFFERKEKMRLTPKSPEAIFEMH